MTARRTSVRHGTIGLDLGTSSLKVVMFDAALRPFAATSRPLRTRTSDPNHSEQDFNAVIRAVASAFAELSDANPRFRPAALGIASHRSSLVAWNVNRRRAASPIVLWNDRRAAPLIERWRANGSGRTFERVSRLPLLPYFFGPRAAALIEDDFAPRDSLLLTVESALLLALGVSAPSTDATFTARTLLARPDGRRDPKLLAIANVGSERLAAVAPTCGERGRLAAAIVPEGWRGAPIHAALADQAAAYLGLAALDLAATTLTIGTGLFAARGTARRFGRGVFPFALPSRGGSVRVGAETNDPSTGTSFELLRELFALPSSLAEFDSLARRGAETAIVIPAATGIGAPWLRPQARAAILGIGPATTRAEIARGILEGTAARAAELLGLLGGRDAVRTGGGGAASRLLLQRIADRSGRAIEHVASSFSGALGAAALARIGLGEEWSQVAATMRAATKHTARFSPRTTPSQRRALAAAFAAAVDAATA
jgi:glycerol kinase